MARSNRPVILAAVGAVVVEVDRGGGLHRGYLDGAGGTPTPELDANGGAELRPWSTAKTS